MPPFIHLVSAAAVYHMRHPITGDLTVSHRTNKAGWNIISALRQCGRTFSLRLCVCLSSTCCNKSPESNSSVPRCSYLISICLQSSRFSGGRAVKLTHLFTLTPASCLVHHVSCLVPIFGSPRTKCLDGQATNLTKANFCSLSPFV